MKWLKGLLYRLRMARADRVWEAARRAERRIHVESPESYAKAFRTLSMVLTKKAIRIETRARKGGMPI